MKIDEDRSKGFHILALSGGGYRGLYTATVLEELEESFGYPLAKHFDLITGTSIGGILALAIADEIPAADLRKLFVEHGTEIFPQGPLGIWRLLLMLRGLVFARYSNKGLKKMLQSVFKDRTLGSLCHCVMVPSVNASTGQPRLFKTPHHPKLEKLLDLPLVEIAMATSAAPYYFPIYRNKIGAFLDGGLIANSPGILGVHEAKQYFDQKDEDNIRVLEIGTLSSGVAVTPKTLFGQRFLSRGLLTWRVELFRFILSAQETLSNIMMEQRLGKNFYRIDEDCVPLEQAPELRAFDKINVSIKDILQDRGLTSAQRALASEEINIFRTHIAAEPHFYHGPHRTGGNQHA